MPDDELTPADRDDVPHALSVALNFDGRRRYHQADDLKARTVAEHLLRHLERLNFAVMKKPAANWSLAYLFVRPPKSSDEQCPAPWCFRRERVDGTVSRPHAGLLTPPDFDAWLDGTSGVEVLRPAAEAALREGLVSPRVSHTGVGGDDPTIIPPS